MLNRYGMTALAIAGAAFGLGVYVNAHGGDTSRIHGCVDNRTGALRIVGAAQTCTGKETALDVYFTSEGCDSTPLVAIAPQQLVGSLTAIGDSVYTNNSTTEQQRELRSVQPRTLGGPGACSALDTPVVAWTGELEEFSLAETGLVGPFTVE